MKVLILAAGLGTRLRLYTDHTPKPLFTVMGKPLLDMMITRLVDSGCTAVMINTHHLHEQIEAFVAQQSYPIPIQTCYEPTILGTGGAIINVKEFWNDRPFMVVNADIITAINLKSVYDFHCQHRHPVTLVLVDDPHFNSVTCDSDSFVTAFQQCSDPADRPDHGCLHGAVGGLAVPDRFGRPAVPDYHQFHAVPGRWSQAGLCPFRFCRRHRVG